MNIELFIPNEEKMLWLGCVISRLTQGSGVIYLNGNLGQGKTTLARGMLRGFGCQGPVKSPTYTFVESYNFKYFFVYHFDLYRLSDPEELEFLGVRDYFSKNSLCLVEWAENGEGFLPAADIEIMIHSYNEGRVLQIDSHTVVGVTLCKELSNLTAEYMRK